MVVSERQQVNINKSLRECVVSETSHSLLCAAAMASLMLNASAVLQVPALNSPTLLAATPIV